MVRTLIVILIMIVGGFLVIYFWSVYLWSRIVGVALILAGLTLTWIYIIRPKITRWTTK
ncbi:MAG: hypothetical protein ABSC49_04325 [Candidatus Microgenomates bacterium]